MTKYCKLPIVALSYVILFFASVCLAAPKSAKNECEIAKSKTVALLGTMQSCTKTEECALINVGCAFGCFVAVSSQSDIVALRNQIDSYSKSCSTCAPNCDPASSSVECKDKKCTVISVDASTVRLKKNLEELKLRAAELGDVLSAKIKKDTDAIISPQTKERLAKELEEINKQIVETSNKLKEQSGGMIETAKDSLATALDKIGKSLSDLSKKLQEPSDDKGKHK